VTVSSRSFLTFVRCYLMSLSFTTWHIFVDFMINILFCFVICFHSLYKTLQVWCRNIVCRNFIVVFLEIFLPVFSALVFTIKLPKPLKYTLSPVSMIFYFIHKSLYSRLYISFSRPNFSEILLRYLLSSFSFPIYNVVLFFLRLQI
jgi:hypothetical protein